MYVVCCVVMPLLSAGLGHLHHQGTNGSSFESLMHLFFFPLQAKLLVFVLVSVIR